MAQGGPEIQDNQQHSVCGPQIADRPDAADTSGQRVAAELEGIA